MKRISNRIALSLAFVGALLGACSKQNTAPTTPKQVVTKFVKCIGACAVGCVKQILVDEPPVNDGIGTSPSEEKE